SAFAVKTEPELTAKTRRAGRVRQRPPLAELQSSRLPYSKPNTPHCRGSSAASLGTSLTILVFSFDQYERSRVSSPVSLPNSTPRSPLTASPAFGLKPSSAHGTAASTL